MISGEILETKFNSESGELVCRYKIAGLEYTAKQTMDIYAGQREINQAAADMLYFAEKMVAHQMFIAIPNSRYGAKQ